MTQETKYTDAITSKAGLIGYYIGSLKGIKDCFENESDLNWREQNLLKTIDRMLAEGDEMWDRVKMH